MRRAWWWLVAAGVLLVVATWLFPDERSSVANADAPSFAAPTPESTARIRERATLTLPRRTSDDFDGPQRTERLDPVHAALPTAEQNVVVEANAILNSPVGKMLLRCLQTSTDAPGLEELTGESGLDWEKDLDRVAFGGRTIVLSGFFEEAWTEGLEGEPIAVGDEARMWPGPASTFGMWRNEVMVFGTEDEVRASLERLEGQREISPDALPNETAYGEAYGWIRPDFVTSLLGADPVAEALIGDAVDRIELHLDTAEDVAMTFSVQGSDSERLEELAQLLVGGLVAARTQARFEKDEELSRLLDHARVSNRWSNGFEVRMAVTLDFIRSQLGACADIDDGPVP